MGDMGMGECAGEVVSRLDFDLQAAERLCFEAQLKLEAKDLAKADELAYKSMLQAAQGLVKELWYDVPNDARCDCERVSRAAVRAEAVLGPVRGRQVRPGLFPSARESADAVRPR